MDERFPTILVLNKIDVSGGLFCHFIENDHTPLDADPNIARICQKYEQNKIVCSSALAGE
jgi:hypothetical protein